MYYKETIGRDHYSVLSMININGTLIEVDRVGEWVFVKPNCEKFSKRSSVVSILTRLTMVLYVHKDS